MRGVSVPILVVTLMLLVTVPTSITTLEEDRTTSPVVFSQIAPSVVSDFLSLNSTGTSSVQAIDHHSNGAWVACAVFNGTVDPVNTLNSQVQSRSSHGDDDVILFGGSSIMNITWHSHLRSTGDSNCRGLKIIDQHQVVVFGTFNNYIEIGTSTQYSEGMEDAYLGIYNFSLQAWTNVTSFGGASDDVIRDITPSSSGFIAVGYTKSDLTTDYSDLFAGGSGDCSSNPCGMVLEYSSDLEAEKANVVSSDQPNGIKFYQLTDQDAQGTVVVVGEFKGNLTLTGTSITGIESAGSQDGMIIEINDSLNFTGINRIGGVSFDSAKSIQRISTGGFLVAMEVTGTYNSTRPYNGVYSSTAGSRDIAVFQLFNNLTINDHYSFGTSGADQVRDLSLLKNSGLFSITGQIDGFLTFGGNTIGIAQGTDSAFFSTLEFNSTGIHPLWAFSTTGSSSSDGQGVAIKHISDGVVYWGGFSSPSGPTGSQIGTNQLLGTGVKAGYIALMDVDQDQDGIGSRYDICPINADPLQEDFDSDGQGDECDEDDDGDGILDANDNCPRDGILFWTSSISQDIDQDGCKDDGSENQGKGQDIDDDNDGTNDTMDACPKGSLNWNSTDQTLDYDSDGCKDNIEDDDDDNDGVLDGDDGCNPPDGMIKTPGSSWDDWDADGCHDLEDQDIDNDNRLNENDLCNYSVLGFNSNLRTLDWDSDGCEDATEDDDDDQDSRIDTIDDECKPPGSQLGTTSNWIDHDSDGCHDDIEDLDDDNDGVDDAYDRCPRGELGWVSNLGSDYDADGCKDASEDNDDDEDGVLDHDDECGRSPPNITDYDGDGCTGELDADWDNDGINNDKDDCIEGELGWSATTGGEDHDSDGCRDLTEDSDDDNDGVYDYQDGCEKGTTGWDSNDTGLDYDGDGCLDSVEDTDDDGDGIDNGDEICDRSPLEDFPDHDSDGCDDLSEDNDDDNDGITDDNDNDNIDNSSCSTSPMNRSQLIDYDQDGCFGQEDKDSDGDGISDIIDGCVPPYAELLWRSGPSTDYDGDGCRDASEDNDDDNDGTIDTVDSCRRGKISWDSTDKKHDFNLNGCHNDEDFDDDNDGVSDGQDKFHEDCRYSKDTDNDGKPNPSSLVDCAYPGTVDFKIDDDSDGDGVTDAHEIACGSRPLDKEDYPAEGYQTEGEKCAPSVLLQLLGENVKTVVTVGTSLLILILLGTMLTPKIITTLGIGAKQDNNKVTIKHSNVDDITIPTHNDSLPISRSPDSQISPKGISDLLNTLNLETLSDSSPNNPVVASLQNRLLTSPPLPVEGLPPGWTQEQWNHYGDTHLNQTKGDE